MPPPSCPAWLAVTWLLVSVALIVLATAYFLALRRGRGVAITLSGPLDQSA